MDRRRFLQVSVLSSAGAVAVTADPADAAPAGGTGNLYMLHGGTSFGFFAGANADDSGAH